MPVQVSYPGVYVQEIPSGVVSISGVATSIALFIGMAQRGPMNSPRLVLNRTAYETLYGTDTSQGEMTDQVRQFFLNGGSQAYVMRVATGAQTATVSVENEFGTEVMTFEAKDAGTIGESVRVEVDYDTSDPESTFNLTVYRQATAPNGLLQSVETEVHKDLSVDPNAGRFVVDVLANESKLITATFSGLAPAATAGFSMSGALGTGAGAAASQADLFTHVDAIINQAILNGGPGTTAGRFEISVDGQPYVPVALTTPSGTASIQTAINAAITPLLLTPVVVSTVNLLPAGPSEAHALLVTSGTPGVRSAVRIRSVGSLDDIAAMLQLGTANFGVEVAGGAVRRPMPTGLVARIADTIGNYTAGVFTALGELLGSAPAAVTGLTLTDTSGAINATPFTFPGGAATLLNDPVAVAPNPPNSLRAGGDNLDGMVQVLNTAFAAAPAPRRWTAVRNGYRIVFKSNLALPDFGPNTTFATAGGGAYVFGAVNTYLEGAAAATSRANVKAYRLNGPIGGFVTGNRPGLNGTAPTIATYDAAYPIVQREVDLFNILMLPRNVGQTDNQRATFWGPASAFCKERRAVLLMDPRLSTGVNAWTDVTTARTGLPALRNGVVKDYTAIYWPRLVINDPVTNAQRRIDPAGTVAGICSRIDASRGIWKAPAGLEASLIGVSDVDVRMSDPENGVINPEALNAIRAFAGGIVVWGARTMDGFDNSGDTDYRYFPVRRTALYIEESLYRGLKFAVFEPNDEPLWGQIRLAAGAFMNQLFRRGAFQGQKTSDAYFVKCDSETTTQTDINLGVVNVLVGFAPLKPAEFVVLTVQQKAGQVQA